MAKDTTNSTTATAAAATIYDGQPSQYRAVAIAAERRLVERLRAGGMSYEVEAALREYRRTALATLAVVTTAASAQPAGALSAEALREHLATRMAQEADALVRHAAVRQDAARRTAELNVRAAIEVTRRGKRLGLS